MPPTIKPIKARDLTYRCECVREAIQPIPTKTLQINQQISPKTPMVVNARDDHYEFNIIAERTIDA